MQLLNMPIDVGNISDANPIYRAEDLAAIEGWMQVAADLVAHGAGERQRGIGQRHRLRRSEVTIHSSAGWRAPLGHSGSTCLSRTTAASQPTPT